MNIRKRLVRWATDVWDLPLVYRVPAIVLVALFFVYVIIFMPSKQVVFSYASKESCTNYFTIFPGALRQSGDKHFKLRAEGVASVAGFGLLATKMCVAPLQAPSEGVYTPALSPMGGGLFKKGFSVKVAKPPAVEWGIQSPVPISRVLIVQLSATDKVFDYQMTIGGKTASCASQVKSIACDIPSLGLVQGKIYDAQLRRVFRSEKGEVVVAQKIKTLSAVHVTKASIKKNETIYSKPRSFTFSFDKPLQSVTPRLYQMVGKKRQAVAITSAHDGKSLKITISKDLPRSTTFLVTLEKVEAIDGSSLASSYSLAFRTSGGPKVVGTNVGAWGVPLGATAVVSFDQTLSAKQDITKLLSLSGGAAYAGKAGNQVYVSLAGVPKCGDFSIKIAGSVQSNYEVASSSVWSFSGRTICHSLQTIGYSVNGRPITAYVFGSGSAVLYTGAIHGNEASTNALMYAWIDELESRARSIPAGRAVVVIPALNPDGVATGSRTNAHNVDLNRNFATSDWRKDITDIYNKPFPGGGGSAPMSEPETKAIASYVQQLRPSRILSYHSIGGLVAANQAGSSGSFASTYSQLSGYSNATGQSDAFEYSVSGTADDWYAQNAGIASILVELGSHSYSQFSLNQSAMWAMLR